MALETPNDGGRVVLTRAAVGDDAVTYQVELHTADGSWSAPSRIVLPGGGIEVGAFEGPSAPPAWLVEAAQAFLRTVVNARKKEDPPRWPRRLRRWRAPRELS